MARLGVVLIVSFLVAVPGGASFARELTPNEKKVKEILGPDTSDPILLWEGKPPRFVENAPPEELEEKQPSFSRVSVPTITPYLPKDKNTGMALIICPGGGYGSIGWGMGVVNATKVLNPMGIAVIGLKYRTRVQAGLSNEDIQAIALLDAKRAVRTVRARAAEWKIDPNQIGIMGYSAGANVSINLAANFDAGDPNAADPIDRLSSRPDFAVGSSTWHWRQKESPFKFRPDTPPVFLIHATNDGLKGGAPIELPRAIEADLKKLGVPVHFAVFDEGAHGVGNLIPQRVAHGFPGAQWPKLLVEWLASIKEQPAKPPAK